MPQPAAANARCGARWVGPGAHRGDGEAVAQLQELVVDKVEVAALRLAAPLSGHARVRGVE